MAVKGTDPPLCRTCGERHSFRDGCKPLAIPIGRTLAATIPRAEVVPCATKVSPINVAHPINVAQDKRKRGRPRVHDTKQDRYRAYRERRKAAYASDVLRV
jgi:hypothetical protein